MNHNVITQWSTFTAPFVLIVLLLLTLISWFQFPALPSNDDALFLSRGIGHFSVIEFSPHFPGYAGLILFTKLFRCFFSSDYQALHTVVVCMTALIPIAVYLILRALNVGKFFAAGVSVTLFLQPLLVSVALSGLSDGPGLLIWLMSLWLLLRRQGVLSAFFTGVTLTFRPSYLLLTIPTYGYLVATHRDKLKTIFLATVTPLLFVFVYMYSKDGLGLIDEGYRFVRGHFLVWGNTTLNSGPRVLWQDVIADYLGSDWALVFISVLLFFACFSVWVADKNARSLVVSFCSIALWTLCFQNPDNLRHLLPVLVLATLIVTLMIWHVLTQISVHLHHGGLGLVRGISVVIMLFSALSLLSVNSQLEPQKPAIHQALYWLGNQPQLNRYSGVVITNEGVELAKRYQKKKRVADAWYKQQSEWLLLNGAWRMSFSLLENYGLPMAVFPRRFKGEHSMYVYNLVPNGY